MQDTFLLRIEIKKDIEQDVQLILREFFSFGMEHFKNRILFFYKQLKEQVDSVEENKKEAVVEEYFRGMYRSKEEQIDLIVTQSKKIIDEKSEICLRALTDLMDYQPKKEEIFLGIPTLLPHSPFNRPIFYFSIAGPLFVGRQNEVLDTAIHEISHFLYFDIVDDLGIDLKSNQTLWHFGHLYKEALTGALLSEPVMEEILNRKNYLGNPEIQELYIKRGGEEKILLREYLRKVFKEYKKKGLRFSDMVNDTVRELLPTAKQFNEKKLFWNNYEQELKKEDSDKRILYAEPIEI